MAEHHVEDGVAFISYDDLCPITDDYYLPVRDVTRTIRAHSVSNSVLDGTAEGQNIPS
jgi:hypothetical protein